MSYDTSFIFNSNMIRKLYINKKQKKTRGDLTLRSFLHAGKKSPGIQEALPSHKGFRGLILCIIQLLMCGRMKKFNNYWYLLFTFCCII